MPNRGNCKQEVWRIPLAGGQVGEEGRHVANLHLVALTPWPVLREDRGSHFLCAMIYGTQKIFPSPQFCIPLSECQASGLGLELKFPVSLPAPFLPEQTLRSRLPGHPRSWKMPCLPPGLPITAVWPACPPLHLQSHSLL